ncbi:hypothetical protein B0I37DRAFT_219676 [Chaetomium sp. MPI-CAGE-AT-0009]|nr:hypothetical protein B0I37DRAFT_219676 [Chaetomium sp. MPI-CAGE-AT-0009]
MPSTSAISATSAMASQMISNPAEGPAAPTSSEGEHHIELVWPDVSTIEQVLEYIVESRQRNNESIIGFHWQASQIHDLFKQLDASLLDLDERTIRRFEYDYESETVYLDIRGQSQIQYQVGMGLRDRIIADLASFHIAVMDIPEISQLRRVYEHRPVPIEYGNKLYKQADVSFAQIDALPSVVCEVS